jgi:hypothetical protein
VNGIDAIFEVKLEETNAKLDATNTKIDAISQRLPALPKMAAGTLHRVRNDCCSLGQFDICGFDRARAVRSCSGASE